jgi:hypothetical protein
MSLWRSGIFWAALGFIGGLGNLVFQIIMKRRLPEVEFGHATTLLGATTFFGLPMQMASTAVIYYAAHFKSHNDQSRLQGLLAGCRSFLFKVTIGGSLLAVGLAAPFGKFFGYSRGEMIAAILCVLVGLWSSFAIALCQGMSWFKRLAVIGFCAVLLRLLFGWVVTGIKPTAEMAVSATTFSLLANLALLYWWKTIFQHSAEKTSPWNREFFTFLVVAGGFVAGNFFFLQGDMLAAKRHFTDIDLNFYTTAGVLARAVPATVSPLLNVFFTSRSGKRSDQAAKDQKILLALYAIGLGCGAIGLIVLRDPFLKVLGKYTPESAALIPRFAMTLALAGLNQAIATWSLASRWFKIALLYGGLGLIYWLVLLTTAIDPAKMLNTMLACSAVAFVILLCAWLNTMRKTSKVAAQA